MEILMLAVLIFVIANLGVKSKPTPAAGPTRPVARPTRPVAVEPPMAEGEIPRSLESYR